LDINNIEHNASLGKILTKYIQIISHICVAYFVFFTHLEMTQEIAGLGLEDGAPQAVAAPRVTRPRGITPQDTDW
jgi:hypothetical protein